MTGNGIAVGSKKEIAANFLDFFKANDAITILGAMIQPRNNASLINSKTKFLHRLKNIVRKS